MTELNIPVRSVQELSSLPSTVDHFTVGESTEVAITRMRHPVLPGEEPSADLLVGDILRRTCKLGGDTCMKAGCQAPDGYKNYARLCSDLNLAGTLKELSFDPEQVLMVGVTADGVGFYDELNTYNPKKNALGFEEVAGFNAFFARESDEVALGGRLADCGFVAIEGKDAKGEKVYGFTHLTRPNMQVDGHFKQEVDGKPAGIFDYFMDKFVKHYGVDINTVQVRVVAAIKANNFVHQFKDEAGSRPDDRFPGWFDIGLLKNTSNPDWQKGDPISPEHNWEPQYRDMVRWQIEQSGLLDDQISFKDAIDPGDLESGHASNHAGAHGAMPDARDAYLVFPSTLA